MNGGLRKIDSMGSSEKRKKCFALGKEKSLRIMTNDTSFLSTQASSL